MLGRIWSKWKVFAHALGRFQTKLILNLFYYAALAPVGILCRWRVDPLDLRRPNRTTSWIPRDTAEPSRDSFREQS